MTERGALWDSYVYDRMLPRERWGLAAAIGFGVAACVVVVAYPTLGAAVMRALLWGAASTLCAALLLRVIPIETTIYVFENGLEAPTLWGRMRFIRWDQVNEISPYVTELGGGIQVISTDGVAVYIPVPLDRLADFRAFAETRAHALQTESLGQQR